MNVKLLIDAIVRQTTVLIAQLSTTAGIRAPLAHVADQVFVELVREIEAQGVGRKVVADMFGMALRSYQKKVQRLTESATVRDRTLWEAVLDFIQSQGSVTRARLLERFKYDGDPNVAAVINDLINSGLIYKTGRGPSTLYGITSEEDYRRLLDEDMLDTVSSLAWVTIYRTGGCTRADLLDTLNVDAPVIDAAIDALLDEGRISPEDSDTGDDDAVSYRASQLTVPVGSEYGWEAAVFDHYQALVTAVSAKVATAAGRSAHNDLIGGATLSFDVYEGHPYEKDVTGQLQAVRAQVNALWEKVSQYNKEHPVADDQKTKVTFYFGQMVENTALDEQPMGEDA